MFSKNRIWSLEGRSKLQRVTEVVIDRHRRGSRPLDSKLKALSTLPPQPYGKPALRPHTLLCYSWRLISYRLENSGSTALPRFSISFLSLHISAATANVWLPWHITLDAPQASCLCWPVTVAGVNQIKENCDNWTTREMANYLHHWGEKNICNVDYPKMKENCT